MEAFAVFNRDVLCVENFRRKETLVRAVRTLSQRGTPHARGSRHDSAHVLWHLRAGAGYEEKGSVCNSLDQPSKRPDRCANDLIDVENKQTKTAVYEWGTLTRQKNKMLYTHSTEGFSTGHPGSGSLVLLVS